MGDVSELFGLEMMLRIMGIAGLLTNTGLLYITATQLTDLLRELSPRSIRSAVLLLKDGCQQVAMKPDFVVFNIPDEFVVGYGLDYQDEYRNLPFVGTLEETDLKRHPSP